MKTICIDAGHGGKDPGACAGGVREKDIALYTVFKIGTLLADYELIYTRFTDVYVSLSKRARIANAAEVDLFVSIHCNSAPNSSANGMEVYVHTSRGADSTRAAHAIYDRLLPASGLRGRGIKSKDLAVLRETDMPAVLVELAFISNDNDRAKLVSDEWQERAAEAIAAGIMEVIGKHEPAGDKRLLRELPQGVHAAIPFLMVGLVTSFVDFLQKHLGKERFKLTKLIVGMISDMFLAFVVTCIGRELDLGSYGIAAMVGRSGTQGRRVDRQDCRPEARSWEDERR